MTDVLHAPSRLPAGRPGAVDIALALGQPPPTHEQRAVIEAPLQPLLVVAGAGSGKTETMAARVVWLVAGGDVSPDEVLGLTFTRKAAGELSDRVRQRLRRLRTTGLWSPDSHDEAAGGEVTVSTYHSFAGRIVREHGLRLGVEPEARLMTEAASWQLASEVVERWSGPMDHVQSAVSTVVAAVLDLAGECAEHLVEVDAVDDWLAHRIAAVHALPNTAAGRRAAPVTMRAQVAKLLRGLRARRQILPIVSAYQQVKRDRDSLDFGDQVALAARLAMTTPALVQGERSRARAVLLDEYQDTSHAQLEMLHALFGAAHPVTAVGDPHQSIYGWRGASAGTLVRFAERFRTADDEPAQMLDLSTSWRNDHAVLAAANEVAAPLRAGSSVPVRRLSARPGAGAGAVQIRSFETVEDEAGAVAEHLATLWWRDGRRTDVTAAVLCRKRSQFEVIEAALHERGLPVEVVGLGGLLTTPEVTDVLAALHVVHDPSRGDRLMRLLTGPSTRLGPRDLVALGSWSRELHRRRTRRERVTGTHPDVVVLADVVDESSLVEALDELPPPGWVDRDGRALSTTAQQRLHALAGTVRGLRGRTGLALPDLVVETERALLLDVEVASRPGARPAVARAHLDALAQVAGDFAASADRPTLGAFLAWLDAAQARERGLEQGKAEVDTDAVQLMTVHAAKGLEWDVVAVPGLVEGTFPAHATRPRHDGQAWVLGEVKDAGWLTDLGSLPHELRGDAAALPDVRWTAAADQPGLESEMEAFRLRGGRHELDEERRLAYVALTRARRRLLLTSHVWSEGSTPRLPSRFVDELADAGLGEVTAGTAGADLPAVGTPNPRTATARSVPWPNDPLGRRRPDVQAGADLVRAAMDANDPPPATAAGTRWAWEADVLLAERDRGRQHVVVAALPTHVSASRLVQLAADPQALALQVRRPMPREPMAATRRGTAFHAWVEQRLGAPAMVDVDDLPGAADEQPAPDGELATLQANFLASEWAGRSVVAVEAAIETPVDGTIVRGRVDAVLARADGGVDVVDWKTGPPPAGREAAARAVQLAAYRLAWSRLHGLPLDRVGAAFFYASTGQTVRPVDLIDEAALVALLRRLDSVG